MSRSRIFLILFGLFLAALFFINLGNYGLLEDNEARFVEVSWEMINGREPLVPKLDFITHFHKPPATFWLVGSSMKLLGTSEFAARLPIVLAAILTLVAAGYVPKQGRTKLFTVLVLACNVEFWLLSRTVLTDMLLTLTVTTCLVSAWTVIVRQDRRASILFWISLGLSTLVKGPIGLAIVGLTLLSFRISTGPVSWRRFKPQVGVPVFLLLTLPWYLYVCGRFPNLFGYLAGFQTVERFATEVHGRGGPLWFFVPVIVVGFLPWTTLLPQSLVRALRERSPLDCFLLSWLLPSLLLFSLSGSKLPTYILPLFPALALLIARYWESTEFSKLSAATLNGFCLTLGLSVIIFSVTGLTPELQGARTSITGAGIMLVGAGIAGLYFNQKQESRHSAVATGVGFGCFLMALSFGLHSVDNTYSAREFSYHIKTHLQQDTVVGEYSEQLCGLPYYLRRRIVQVAFPRETLFEEDDGYKSYLFDDIEDFNRVHKGHALMVVRRSDYQEEKFPGWKVVERKRWLLLEREPLQRAKPIQQGNRPRAVDYTPMHLTQIGREPENQQ
jgi:4-amino-4-deoxy-L-arabinose transferase-like glycosyltransferase